MLSNKYVINNFKEFNVTLNIKCIIFYISRLSRPMSPMPNYSDDDITPECSPRHLPTIRTEKELKENLDNSAVTDSINSSDKNTQQNGKSNTLIANGNDDKENKSNNVLSKNENRLSIGEVHSSQRSTEIGVEITESNSYELRDENDTTVDCQETSSETAQEMNVPNTLLYLAQLKNDLCGFPLKLFYQGYLCLPYLSLPYMDLLSDVNVRGYVVGATNVLFKQKRQLFDILVDIDVGRIECQDAELRKQLHLTTEDLRYV